MKSILINTALLAAVAFLLFGWVAVLAQPTNFDIAHYEDEGVIDPLNWEEIAHDNMLLNSVQAEVKEDLVAAIGIDFKFELTAANAKIVNAIVNMKFPYRLDRFDYWHAQTPLETVVLGSGDCKALAVYKYHLLKQLGYKNVKVLTIIEADGRGDNAGHAVVLLNDVWVLDINHPYFYNFAHLRANVELYKAFDETGVRLIAKYKDSSDD
jgi:predicted transglutaminase-like cysteine proteinase